MLLLSILTTSVRLNCHTSGHMPQRALWWAKEGSNGRNVSFSLPHSSLRVHNGDPNNNIICASSHQSHTGRSVGGSVHFHFYFYWCSRCASVWTLCVHGGHDTTTAMAHVQNTKYFIPYITSRVACHTLWTEFKRGLWSQKSWSCGMQWEFRLATAL